MKTYVALLRAVNLPGHNKVTMADLREFLAAVGMREPRTLLQSGNAVFQSSASSSAALEKKLESEAAKRLGLETEFFVRAAQDWEAVIAGNPFPSEARSDPGHLMVMFLKRAPVRGGVAALQAAIKGREVVKAASGPHAYLVYPDGIGRSRVTNALIEKHLGTTGTGRNWNTVLKLGELSSG
jgi:uncharacterized protein (DUF1697 family)